MIEVIPVIDVRGGAVVAAYRGDRSRYQPLKSPFAATPDPVAVALGLRTLFPFPTLYVADLDGIEGRGADLATQQRLAASWPGAELWIDDGSLAPSPLPDGERSRAKRVGEGADSDPLIKSELPGNMIKSHVLGSESLTTLADYENARATAGSRAPLSLDFRGDDFIGPRELLDNEPLWPDRVIVMTLVRVGSGEGPDLARLARIVARAGNRAVYAAGGVRHLDDLRALGDIGVAGALIATALHTGRIARTDLEALAQ
jgi:phosphoribosylformimino-5-aminoimidazole carboxamide ribotide isomerase